MFILLSTLTISLYCMDANEYGQFQNMVSDISKIKKNLNNSDSYAIQNYNGCIKRKSYLQTGQENTGEIGNFLQYRADIRNAEIEYQNCLRNKKNINQYSQKYTDKKDYDGGQAQETIFKKTDYSKGNEKSPQIVFEDLHLYNIKKLSKFRNTKDRIMIECANGNFMLPKTKFKKSKKLYFTKKLNNMITELLNP